MRLMRELVRLLEEPRVCSYLPNEVASLEYRLVQGLDAERYQQLLERGYRRFGRQLFRPQCPGCRQCVSVRVLVDQFEPNRGFRRVLQRNEHIQVLRDRPFVTNEHVDLYNRYHLFMHGLRGWRRDRIVRADYVDSFVTGGGDFAWQWMFFEGEKLVGVALMDETPDAVSLVYFFHDPEWRSHSPGTFSILKQLEYARERGKRHSYPGYWIPANQSMAYKARFRPFERLLRHPVDDENPRWELHHDADPVEAAPRAKLVSIGGG